MVGAGVDVESVAVRLCAGGDVGAAVGATHPRRPGVPLGGRRNGAGQLGALRRRHGRGINNLFRQVLEVARKLGLGRLGHVAIDSTRVRGAASRDRGWIQKRSCGGNERGGRSGSGKRRVRGRTRTKMRGCRCR